MGIALVERLRLAGIEIVVYDVSGAARDQARSLGALVLSTHAEVAAESTIVHVAVRTDQDVTDCMLGQQGVLNAAKPDTLVLLHSTILPQTSRQMEEAARSRSVFVMDACMVGVPATVRAGNLVFLLGGQEELVARVRPHLLKLGKRALHMGPVGAGNVAKLLTNLANGAETLILEEVLRLGMAGGVAYTDTLEMLREIHSESVLNRWQKIFDPSGADPTPRAGRNILNKDVPLAAELARRYKLKLPIVEQLEAAARRVVQSAGSK